MRTILFGQIRPQLFFAPPDDDGGGEGDEQRAGGREQIHISKEARNFGKRFQPPPGTTGIPAKTDPPLVNENEPPAGETEEQKAAREKAQQTRRADDPSVRRKPGENLPQILEGKRRAEAALKEKEDEIKKYTGVEIPKLTAQIAELQKKVDGGTLSTAKEAEYEAKIADLQKVRDETDEMLKGELETTRKRLAQLSLPDDPIYKERYLKPLGLSIEGMTVIVGNNTILKGALDRAMLAQKAALSADSEESMRAAEGERDQILDSMLEGMGETQKRRMTAAFDRFIDASTAQAYAQAEHEKTSLEIRKESERRQVEGIKSLVQEWESEYARQSVDFDEDMTLTDEEKATIKDADIQLDIEAENKFAHGAIKGELKKPDTVRLIHRGRAYAVVKAKLQAANIRLKEAEETITKLRGAAPSGGSRPSSQKPPVITTGGTNQDGKTVNRDGKTRQQWAAERFRPPSA